MSWVNEVKFSIRLIDFNKVQNDALRRSTIDADSKNNVHGG